jgi:L-seryl-tRNA(Ser) seleniumtransferase
VTTGTPNSRARKTANSELFRELPSVDEVVRRPGVVSLSAVHGNTAVTDAIRTVLASLREEISSGLLDSSGLQLALGGLTGAIEGRLCDSLRWSLRSLVNATGVILHTNLGRAPLSESALQHIRETAGRYSNLEFEIESGTRGKRDVHVHRLLCKLLGDVLIDRGTTEKTVAATAGISTIVVNNNAAAVLLALNTLAEGGEVIVSRGELVEIGGSFRIPDVMAKSGAVLREVGTTNRTRVGDYEAAITERTRLLLRVHRSNFEITGFTEQASATDLVELARRHNLPVMEDLGSGALVDLQTFGIAGEPSVFDSLRSGMDIVAYSGDKLLGGPQAGLISGRPDLIARMRANSLFRALRVDKLTYAAFEATLLSYVKRDHDAIPTLKMMRLTKDEIGGRAEAIASGVNRVAESPRAASSPVRRMRVEIIDGESLIGGGAAPSSVLPTRLLAVSCAGLGADELAASLRADDPPIIARVEDGRVLLDLRTVFPDQDSVITLALARIA